MLYEKNAIFSAWLMRRIGAKASEAEALGFFTMPVARIAEPSEGSSEGSGSASAEGAGSRDDCRSGDGLTAASGFGRGERFLDDGAAAGCGSATG